MVRVETRNSAAASSRVALARCDGVSGGGERRDFGRLLVPGLGIGTLQLGVVSLRLGYGLAGAKEVAWELSLPKVCSGAVSLPNREFSFEGWSRPLQITIALPPNQRAIEG